LFVIIYPIKKYIPVLVNKKLAIFYYEVEKTNLAVTYYPKGNPKVP
jgi:hypothetical protein